MSEILFQYKKMDPATWAYLSSLLLIGLYFKFNRIWSLRNLDLILCVLLAPGLLLVYHGHSQSNEASAAVHLINRLEVAETGKEYLVLGRPQQPLSAAEFSPSLLKYAPHFATQLLAINPEDRRDFALQAEARGKSFEFSGYLFLFGISGVWLVRLLLDATMVRRPLLEPNLSAGGLTFLGICLFVFLMANVIVSTPSDEDLKGPQGAQQLLTRTDSGTGGREYMRRGPGYYLISLLPSIPTMPFVDRQAHPNQQIAYATAAKSLAVLSHLAVVAAIVCIGYMHFDNIRTGVGTATLYLMLPYTAQMTGQVDHVLPAALLLWAVVLYRRPLPAGIFIGLAMGVCYYPLFLLPLWFSFYWHRGLVRFALGLLVTVVVMALSLLFVSENVNSYIEKLQAMFGLWKPVMEGLQGIWALGWEPVFRLPILTAVVILSISMAVWPAQKNLGTLLSCSAAIMVATQFWHGYEGGTYMAWYLPLLLLTVFRPNLEDRVALTVLGESWLGRRRARAAALEQAA